VCQEELGVLVVSLEVLGDPCAQQGRLARPHLSGHNQGSLSLSTLARVDVIIDGREVLVTPNVHVSKILGVVAMETLLEGPIHLLGGEGMLFRGIQLLLLMLLWREVPIDEGKKVLQHQLAKFSCIGVVLPHKTPTTPYPRLQIGQLYT